jgi:hypothetical protein
MILRLALRSLLARPARSMVLACGFGLGVAVMASLLGIGEVMLEQARTPALRGGGDVVVFGATGQVSSARYVLSSVLHAAPLSTRVAAASPTQRAAAYLVRGGRVVAIRARGGVPSLERALADPETSSVAAWTDTTADAAWASPEPGAVLRSMDRFHPIPDVPARAASWAEWLYFNGRSGESRFYLTFLVGARRPDGRRTAGARLQLDHAGRRSSFSEAVELEDGRVLAEAPDLVIGASRVRLEGLRYRLTIDLPEERPAVPGGRTGGRRARGELVIDAAPGRSLPPFAIRGAGGWVSGYVVPVMTGALGGTLDVGGERVSFSGGAGYHDHNWGFWEGVTWQWGQVEHDGLSFVYGRVHPPADAADPERTPGFLAALGPQGPLGYSADVSIEETIDPASGRPRHILVKGRGPSLALTMTWDLEQVLVTRMPLAASGRAMDFFQMRGRCRVAGQAGGRPIDFAAAGSSETFRGR